MDKMSLVRTVLLVLALSNQLLAAAGKSPLPLSDELVETVISTGFTVVASLWSWWKNNYISKIGQAQKEVLDQKGLYEP